MHASKVGRAKRFTSSRNQEPNEHLQNLQERLHKTLNLGIRTSDGKTRQWWNTDAEVQGQSVRAISAFVTNLSPSITRQSSVQASLNDIMIALQGLLQSESEQICNTASEVSVKLTAILGGSLLKFGGEELVVPLAQLLPCPKSTIAISCAVALNCILEKVKSKSILNDHCGSSDTVWKALKETKTLDSIVEGLEKYDSSEAKSGQFYAEFAKLLSTILWRWPASRYIVGNNKNLRLTLLAQSRSHDACTASAALRASSALALCGEVAMKQIKDKEVLWPAIRQCLDHSRPRVVRIEAFRFLQSLARSATGCTAMAGTHLGAFVEGIIKAMGEWRSCLHEKWPPDLEMLVMEACRAANALLRWRGEHHSCFWKMGIEGILSDLLLYDHSDSQQWSKSMIDIHHDQQGDTVINKFHINKHPVIRPLLWDILGWLAMHSEVNLDSTISRKKESINKLISFACLMLMKTVHRRGQIRGPRDSVSPLAQDIPDMSEREPICRTVLLLVFSPCKHLASQARFFLEQAMEPYDHEWLQSLLHTLELVARENANSVSDNLLTVVSLMALASFSSLKQYRDILLSYNAPEILSRIIRLHPDNEVCLARSNISSHVVSISDGRICCWNDTEDWEGKNVMLFVTLWAFSKLVPDSDFARNVKQLNFVEGYIDETNCEETETRVLIRRLQKLVTEKSVAPGVRWYAAYGMACFGIYGFPSKLGEKIRKAFDNDEMADLLLVLSDGHSLYAHLVILAARCPSLLPSSHPISKQNVGSVGDGLLKEKTIEQLQQKVSREVRLSAKLHYAGLQSVLEFVYTGIVQIGDKDLSEVRLLAKRCNLEPLFSLLSGRTPSWGMCAVQYKLTSALDVISHKFSDVILQAQGQKQSNKSCHLCTLVTEHAHVHRIVLSLNSDYLHALFRSGMRESCSQVISVPVGWKALSKLVDFFYSGEMNSYKAGCLWNNTDAEQQLEDLQAYIELSWLAQRWLLEDVQDICLHAVREQLKLNLHLCPKIIQNAADCAQWAIVEEATQCMAPAYSWMRDKGELQELDDELVDIVRIAHVRLSQNGKKWE
eukprot:Gb_04418 [translate_table: standard]